MAKLPRTTQKIFAKNAAAGQVTTFGSIKDGTPVYSTSAGDIMNSNFEDGWSAAVEDDYAPYRQDRNGVDTAVTQQLAYLFQEGIPEYDSGTVYYKGSICKVIDGTGVKIYKSIYDNHSAAVTNTSRWHLILNIDSSNNIVSPSISSPTISGGNMSNGTFSNPTFSGTVNVPLASASSSTDSTIAASIGWVNNPNLSSNIVHKTGDETVSGSKTFVSTLQTTTNIVYKRNAITKGTNPESTQNWQFFFADKNGSGDANALGKIQTSVDSTGLVTTSMYALKNASGTSSARIAICYPSSGSAYTYAPTPATSDNSTKIATTAFVKAQSYITGITSSDVTTALGYTPANDSNVVKTSGNQTIAGTKTFSSTISGSIDGNAATVTNGVYTTGNQTIGGTKTFTSNITIKKSNPTLQQDNTGMTKGTAPSANINNYSISYRDNDGKNVGSLIFHYNTNKDVHARLYVYKSSASTDTADTYLRVYYNADGKYGILLSADNADNDTNESLTKVTTSVNDVTIPCMGWVNKVLNTSGRGLATFSKAANGYYKFTNGLIIQWGYINSSASSITYSQPFSSATSYSITTTSIRSSGGTNWRGQVNTRTTTNCNIVTDSSSEWLWIAIGY